MDTNFAYATQLELPNIINYKLDKWEIVIHQSDCDSPRDWDNIGEFCVRDNRNIRNESEYGPEDYKTLSKTHIMLPVSIYNHSGVSIYIGSPCCQWDSAYLGYYICSKAKIREQYGVKRISKKLLERVINRMKSEVKTFNAWFNGEVYGFTLYHNDEEIDRMGGFIDDTDDYAGYINEMYEYFPKEFRNAFTVEEAKDMCYFK